ncbi:MAG TPA: hypothetical protein VLC55_09795 [Burkholderiales bacterium]|nr:hypothetical protein [Burkholderiales bacterium]
MITTPFRNAWRAAAALALAALVAGCATTQIVSQWTDPKFKAGPLKKVLIFIAAKDDAVRRSAEDEAVRGLTGVTKGVASYTLYPDQSQLGKANEAAIRSRLEKEGFDGALVVRLQTVDKDTVYVPPQTYGTLAPAGPMPYGSFYGYTGYAYGYVYTSPGYTYQESKYLIEAMVYKVPQGNMIWTATTESVNPDSRAQLSQDVRRALLEDLVKDGIIGK